MSLLLLSEAAIELGTQDFIAGMSGTSFALLVCVAALAGLIDAIAGGGGLLTVPALLLAGVPPTQALATNKVQGAFGAASAAFAYARRGHVDLRRQLGAAALAFAAGCVGAFSVSAIPTETLRWVLPLVLLGIAAFFALRPGLDDHDRARRMAPLAFALTIVPLVAFYDGLIGPGAGAFYMIGFVTLAGHGVLKATAHTKLLNLASNLGGLAGFAAMGAPIWALGLAMGVAQMLGAALGARLAMRSGARLIKPLLVITATALAIRLLLDLI